MNRWPVIRHIRWFYLHGKFLRWWYAHGRHLGAVPNQADLDYLEDVWKGRV